MMDRIRCMEVFALVAKFGNFSKAASELNMSRSSVTKHIASLEHELSGLLFDRTTRTIVLTEMGEETLRRIQGILDNYKGLVNDLHTLRNEVKGLIKVSAPPVFGAKYLIPEISKFCSAYPEIEVDLCSSDPAREPLSKGCDIHIGFQHIEDENYTSFPLVNFKQVIVASPSYLEAHGAPATPNDLETHNCLINTQRTFNNVWRFFNGTSVSPRSTLHSDYGEVIKQATLLGQGISLFPYYFVSEECESGALRILLKDHEPGLLQFFVTQDRRRVVPLRVRRFLECLKTLPVSVRSSSGEEMRPESANTAARSQRKPTVSKFALERIPPTA